MRTPRWRPPAVAAVPAVLLIVLAAGCAGGPPGGTGSTAAGSPPVTGSAAPSSAAPSAATSGVPGPAASGPPTASPGPTAAGGSPAAGPAPSNRTDVLVRYGRQGGIAGVADQLEIRADGSFTLTTGRPRRTGTGRLDGDEVASVRRALADSRFADLQTFNLGAAGADRFSYQVEYQGRQVFAQDGAVPTGLRPVVALLDRLVAAHG